MRRVLLVAYVAYLLTAAYLVLWPQPDTPAGVVAGLEDALASVGAGFVSGSVVEFLLNVALFVPLTLGGVLLWPRVNPLWWVALGVGGTVLIECVQLAMLPDRSGTAVDLVSNGLGTLLGVDLGLRLRFHRRDRAAQRESPERSP